MLAVLSRNGFLVFYTFDTDLDKLLLDIDKLFWIGFCIDDVRGLCF